MTGDSKDKPLWWSINIKSAGLQASTKFHFLVPLPRLASVHVELDV